MANHGTGWVRTYSPTPAEVDTVRTGDPALR